jgi:hypothetical protein
MKETADALESAWKEKHFKDAEATFERAKKPGFVYSGGPSFFQKGANTNSESTQETELVAQD